MIARGSELWQYLSEPQKDLYTVGTFLIEDRRLHPHKELSDYSYLVFPFAKLYEGFLKQLFLDLGIITKEEYEGDHFRIGKALSPTLAKRLKKKSAYRQLQVHYKHELADELWMNWKKGRNQVFHYFPHNLRALTENEAIKTVQHIITAMHNAVTQTRALAKKHKRAKY